MATYQHRGEPYRLKANRIVFTNWNFVRSESGYNWTDIMGNKTGIITDYDMDSKDVVWKSKIQNYGIKLVAEKPKKSAPILMPEYPWEGRGVALTIMKEDSHYTAWGSSGWHYDKQGSGQYLLYYTSDDGYNWKRPSLGLFEAYGTKNNNIISDVHGWRLHNGGVFIDPSAPPEERYKWFGEDEIPLDSFDFEKYVKENPKSFEKNSLKGKKVHTVRGAYSKDGIHWTYLDEPIMLAYNDTHVTGYYDKALKKYVMYTRDYMMNDTALDEEGSRIKPEAERFLRWRRAIGRAESDNFSRFPLSDVVLMPDCSWNPNWQIYTNCYTTIPGMPEGHLMFPTIWDTGDDTTKLMAASSYDGKTWQFVSTAPIFDTDTHGEYDGGCFFAYPDLIELNNGDFVLPYTGFNVPHKYPRLKCMKTPAYLVWEKGRIFGVEASEIGEFAVSAIIPPGQNIYINAVTRRAGSISIEVCGPDEEPLLNRTFEDCDIMFGDLYKKRVTWKGEAKLGISSNMPVILKIKLNRATLYSIDFD